MGFFRREATPVLVPPEYLAALTNDNPDKRLRRELAQAEPALSAELHEGEVIENIWFPAAGMLFVTDSRLILVARGRVTWRCDRAALHVVETKPRPKWGYEMLLHGVNGRGLGAPTFDFPSLADANQFRSMAFAEAESRITLAPEDIVRRMSG